MLNKSTYALVGLLLLNPAIILAYQSFNGPIHIDTSEYSVQRRPPATISRSIASIPSPVQEVIPKECLEKDKGNCPQEE